MRTYSQLVEAPLMRAKWVANAIAAIKGTPMRKKQSVLHAMSFLLLVTLMGLLQMFVVATVWVAGNSNAGSLDSSFGTGGIVLADLGGFDVSTDVAIHPDGKITIVGTTFGPSTNFVLVQYHPDGTLNQNFGAAGIAITNLGGTDIARALAIHNDKIIVVGESNVAGSNAFVIIRYDSNGNRDSSFGDDGIVMTQITSASDGAWALALQPDGKYVVAGEAHSRFATARYNSNGSLDETFGESGVVREENVGFTATTVRIQPDGKIVVAGRGSGVVMVRYHADGSRDTHFGNNGVVATGPPLDAAWDMVIQPDGKIVAVGGSAFLHDESVFYHMAISRFESDGSSDTGFGDNGTVIVDFGPEMNGALAVELQVDGKLLIAGHSSTAVSTQTFTLVRLLANGELDVTFGENGITNSGTCCRAQALALQSDNKIVVTGYGSGSFLTARFENDTPVTYSESVYLPIVVKP
jgi:uncharacterized delta-60 repeat protein